MFSQFRFLKPKPSQINFFSKSIYHSSNLFKNYSTQKFKTLAASLDSETIVGVSIATGTLTTLVYLNTRKEKPVKHILEEDFLNTLLCDNLKFTNDEKEGFIQLSRAFLWDEESYPYFISNKEEAQSWFAEFTNDIKNFSSPESSQQFNLVQFNSNSRKYELIQDGAEKLGLKFDKITPDLFRRIQDEIIIPKTHLVKELPPTKSLRAS